MEGDDKDGTCGEGLCPGWRLVAPAVTMRIPSGEKGGTLVTWAHLCHCGSPEAQPWAFSSPEPCTVPSAGSQIVSCTVDGSALCHWVSRQQSHGSDLRLLQFP